MPVTDPGRAQLVGRQGGSGRTAAVQSGAQVPRQLLKRCRALLPRASRVRQLRRSGWRGLSDPPEHDGQLRSRESPVLHALRRCRKRRGSLACAVPQLSAAGQSHVSLGALRPRQTLQWLQRGIGLSLASPFCVHGLPVHVPVAALQCSQACVAGKETCENGACTCSEWVFVAPGRARGVGFLSVVTPSVEVGPPAPDRMHAAHAALPADQHACCCHPRESCLPPTPTPSLATMRSSVDQDFSKNSNCGTVGRLGLTISARLC